MRFEIIELGKDEGFIWQAAEILSAAFQWNEDWRTFEGALQEVHDVLEAGIIFIALEGETVLGWIGGLEEYDDYVWELHPLVIRPEAQRRGVGQALVAHLEDAARAAGIMTMRVGADDGDGRTNLSQIDDVYAELPTILGNIVSLDPNNPHPVDFYRRCGYTVVGIVPDANGPRKPDILLAKRLF